MSYYHLFREKDGKYYFNLTNSRKKVILQSEGYLDKKSAEAGIESLREFGTDPQMFVINRFTNGQLSFIVYARNNQVIGLSGAYSSELEMKRGMEEVIELVQTIIVREEVSRAA